MFMQDLTGTKDQKKVWELIKDIRTALLVTHGENEALHARPMVAMGKAFDGILWFFTKADSPKIGEIKHNPNILLSYSHPSKQEYVSIQGIAEVSSDRAKIHELWSEIARIWFPEGRDDPTIRIIKVKVDCAEYWDSPAGSLVMIYGYAKARFTGEVPKVGENKKVAF
jgi:general stress protein 26